MIFDAYVQCALWSSTDTDPAEEDRDNADPICLDAWDGDLAEEARAAMRENLDGFLNDPDLAADLELWADTFGVEQIGHDFWLTHEHHGTGFWDRDYSPGPVRDAGNRLTDASDPYGVNGLYIGDDGKVYLS
jgi:hypothetical protein